MFACVCARSYACLPQVYMPLFRYNLSASLTNAIADAVVKPNLSLALIARDVMIGSMYGGFAVGGLFLLGTCADEMRAMIATKNREMFHS